MEELSGRTDLYERKVMNIFVEDTSHKKVVIILDDKN